MDQAVWVNSVNCAITVLKLKLARLCSKSICTHPFDNVELLWAPAFDQKQND